MGAGEREAEYKKLEALADGLYEKEKAFYTLLEAYRGKGRNVADHGRILRRDEADG